LASKKPFLSFVIDEKLLTEIDNFWHQRQFSSRAAAIKWLIEWALKQQKQDN